MDGMTGLADIAYPLVVFGLAVLTAGFILRERRMRPAGIGIVAAGMVLDCAASVLARDWAWALLHGLLAAGAMVLLITDPVAPWRQAPGGEG
jgi:hypothetical protein